LVGSHETLNLKRGHIDGTPGFPFIFLFSCFHLIHRTMYHPRDNLRKGRELRVAGYTMFVYGSIAGDPPCSVGLRRIAVGVNPFCTSQAFQCCVCDVCVMHAKFVWVAICCVVVPLPQSCLCCPTL